MQSDLFTFKDNARLSLSRDTLMIVHLEVIVFGVPLSLDHNRLTRFFRSEMPSYCATFGCICGLEILCTR